MKLIKRKQYYYYYHDEVNDDFANTNIETQKTPDDFEYLMFSIDNFCRPRSYLK